MTAFSNTAVPRHILQRLLLSTCRRLIIHGIKMMRGGYRLLLHLSDQTEQWLIRRKGIGDTTKSFDHDAWHVLKEGSNPSPSADCRLLYATRDVSTAPILSPDV
jgi:hypothetical protein